MQLTEKHRPAHLSDIAGQSSIVGQLGAFCADPYSTAMLFTGDSGTGKTSAALALANDLGVAMDMDEFGGLHIIASGEQTADSVRDVLRKLWFLPMYGKGWRVLIVNECDRMATPAETIWLDALESLPAHCVVIFTTNHPEKLSDRFRDRCERYEFASDLQSVGVESLSDLARKIWREETGEMNTKPRIKLSAVEQDGKVSFRRLVQEVQRCIRLHDCVACEQARGLFTAQPVDV